MHCAVNRVEFVFLIYFLRSLRKIRRMRNTVMMPVDFESKENIAQLKFNAAAWFILAFRTIWRWRSYFEVKGLCMVLVCKFVRFTIKVSKSFTFQRVLFFGSNQILYECLWLPKHINWYQLIAIIFKT